MRSIRYILLIIFSKRVVQNHSKSFQISSVSFPKSTWNFSSKDRQILKIAIMTTTLSDLPQMTKVISNKANMANTRRFVTKLPTSRTKFYVTTRILSQITSNCSTCQIISPFVHRKINYWNPSESTRLLKSNWML